MSEHDDFDAEGLRRLDVPRRPDPSADDRIRAAMLDAFDAAAGGAAVVDDDVEVIALDDARPDDVGRRQQWPYLAAVAGLILLAALGVLLTTGDGDQPTDFTEQNEQSVATFCATTYAELDDDLVTFITQPGGERTDRALRNIELLAQAYADLGGELGGPLSIQVAGDGADFLERAAAIRREGVDDAMLEGLIGDVAEAVETLPGASGCATAPLKGE